eukprot:7265385-Pyramimonas_sp.AAC.1
MASSIAGYSREVLATKSTPVEPAIRAVLLARRSEPDTAAISEVDGRLSSAAIRAALQVLTAFVAL